MPTEHVRRSSFERKSNSKVRTHEGMESTPVTGHIKAPILQLKFNDERDIDCPDDADKKMDLHDSNHREMKPYTFNQGHRGIDYPEIDTNLH
ncbi:hypothetical protein DPMN_169714 [Dreissena polymorpha]|uniref:Uncharacterized protein n=1 Tax=Dreissena polymorpha TaxID=45954 RepID=A0A9D4IAW4_DREPO|nr:hypothetical protein DPMN_169714 [Dreissena polymorpha]